jgi:hypothetical protein
MASTSKGPRRTTIYRCDTCIKSCILLPLLITYFYASSTTIFVLAVHRADQSKYFLFLEPDATKKSKEPVDDELTQSLEEAMAQSETGTSDYTNLKCKGKFRSGGSYRGFHFGEDGETSTVADYLLPNGFITNSLSLHYLRFYRTEIPKTEMKKLEELHEFMTTQKRWQTKNNKNNKRPASNPESKPQKQQQKELPHEDL